MNKKNLRISLTLMLLLSLTILANAQEVPLKVENGVLYTIDGKWGNGIRAHYSTCKGNCNAKVYIEPGEHTFEYFFMKEYEVYKISFVANADMKYAIKKDGKEVIVMENKTVLNNARIENISVKDVSDKDEIYQLSGVNDKSKTACFIWDDEDEYYPNGGPNFVLRKINDLWGTGSMGYFNRGLSGGIKVFLPAGEHTFCALLSFGSRYAGNEYISNKVDCFSFHFEEGKTYTVKFDNFGFNPKTMNESQKKMVLESVKIIEVAENNTKK